MVPVVAVTHSDEALHGRAVKNVTWATKDIAVTLGRKAIQLTNSAKEMIAMAALSENDARALFALLDENIGVFRTEEMNARAQAFYEDRKEDFIRQYSAEIPFSYWFQGVGCHSVELFFDSTLGFHLESAASEKCVQDSLTEMNAKMKPFGAQLRESALEVAVA